MKKVHCWGDQHMVDNSWRTARSRTTPALPVAWFVFTGKVVGLTLHHGCGRDEPGTELLRKYASAVQRYDPYVVGADDDSVLTSDTYRTIVSSYVLNVLPRRHRRHVLKVLADCVRVRDGLVLIAVRRWAGVRFGRKYEDGYLRKNGTFQRGYTVGQLREELKPFFTNHIIYQITKDAIYAAGYHFDESSKPQYTLRIHTP